MQNRTVKKNKSQVIFILFFINYKFLIFAHSLTTKVLNQNNSIKKDK